MLEENICKHKRVSKEYFFGKDETDFISTGDYICDDCGEILSENPNQ